jgi:hypothetical protein
MIPYIYSYPGSLIFVYLFSILLVAIYAPPLEDSYLSISFHLLTKARFIYIYHNILA